MAALTPPCLPESDEMTVEAGRLDRSEHTPWRARVYRLTQAHTPWFFILPGLIALLVVAIYPILYSTALSFFRVTFASTDRPFVGLENFASILRDEKYRTTIFNTVLYVLVTVSISFAVGFG